MRGRDSRDLLGLWKKSFLLELFDVRLAHLLNIVPQSLPLERGGPFQFVEKLSWHTPNKQNSPIIVWFL